MKKIIKTISALLALIMVLEMPLTVLASTMKSKYTGLNYTQNSRYDDYKIVNGIDVSEHNGKVDFDKVKKDGIDFVFIRVGYTGYTKSGFILKYDKNYKTYLADAKNAGLDVGVYWYSQALTPAEATDEAVKLLAGIEGISLELPVVYDYEFAGTSAGRLDSAKLSKAKKTENALAFLNTVASAGYEACLYASENFLLNEMNASDIDTIYPIWLANYNTKTSYKGSYDFWQYSSKGNVSGISGNTDVNFRYINENVIKLDTQIYTGEPITPDPAVIDPNTGNALIKDTDYILEYKDNADVGTARIIATGINSYTDFTAQYSFKIVPDKVSDLTCIGTDDTILSFSWNDVAGAQEYNFYLTNTVTKKTYCYNTSLNYITIGKLTAGTKYSVYAVAGRRNSSGDVVFGEASDSITAITTGAKVSGFGVKTRGADSVTLKWNKLENADGYKIYIYDSNSKTYKLQATVGNTTSYKVSSLKGATTYKFKISAIVSGKEEKKSDALKTVTTPKKMTLSSAKSTAKKKITVNFKSTTANGYQVQWSTKKNFSSDYKSMNVSRSKKTAKITTSKSKKTYYVRIRAYKTLDGKKYYGSWSSTKTVKVK